MAFGGQGLDYCQLAENQREEIKRQNGDGMKANIKLRTSQQAASPVPPGPLMLPANALNTRLLWLSNAQDIISGHWRKLNASKRKKNKRTSLS